jgi:hypothetical protein
MESREGDTHLLSMMGSNGLSFKIIRMTRLSVCCEADGAGVELFSSLSLRFTEKN